MPSYLLKLLCLQSCGWKYFAVLIVAPVCVCMLLCMCPVLKRALCIWRRVLPLSYTPSCRIDRLSSVVDLKPSKHHNHELLRGDAGPKFLACVAGAKGEQSSDRCVEGVLFSLGIVLWELRPLSCSDEWGVDIGGYLQLSPTHPVQQRCPNTGRLSSSLAFGLTLHSYHMYDVSTLHSC